MTPLVKDIPSDLVLSRGSHDEDSGDMCVMEAIAFVAGEPWSDRPQCVCPVIGQFLRSWNDAISDDEERTRLLAPLIPKLINTRSTAEVELARVMLCIDWLCREFAPAWLDLIPALKPHAAGLRACKPIESWDDLDAIISPLRSAQESSDASRAAVRDAAWDAAYAAALATAWGAALDASLDAAWTASRAAAWNAAREASSAAVGAAAREASWGAAWAALSPTKEKLQRSALALVERMIAVK